MNSNKFNILLSELLTKNWNANSNLNELSNMFIEELLEYGSETPDNLNCANHIEIGQFSAWEQRRHGIKVKNKDVSISEVMNVIENMTLPEEVKEYFPDLTEEEWSAVTRVITLILTALDE